MAYNLMQTILITGASEGMGLSVAKILSFKGANVVLVSRGVDKLKDALEIVKVRICFASCLKQFRLTQRLFLLRQKGCRQRQEQAAFPLHRRRCFCAVLCCSSP